METALHIRLADAISRKYGKEKGLRPIEVFGASFEAVLKAIKTFDSTKGKSFRLWAYYELKGELTQENYHPRQYGEKARFTRLDDEGYNEDWDGMSNHEKISKHHDAREAEDEFIRAIRVSDALRIRNGMSPKLKAIVDADVLGYGLEEAAENVDGRKYTPQRVHQLRDEIVEMVAEAEGEDESGQLGLFDDIGEGM